MNEDDEITTVQVGTAIEVVTPEPGGLMGGYASRAAPSSGVLDDLYCRVVVFGREQTVLVLVTFDMLYVPAQLAETVATEIARELHTDADHVLVSATHTHCGPAIAGPGSDAVHRVLAAAALRCAVAAQVSSTNALLFRTGFSAAGLIRHRRDPPEDVDDTGTVLLALSDTTGEVIASIVAMACHPTVLEGDTVAYSRDFPGVVCDVVEATCGGRAMFLQGFAGDTNPIFHDHSPEDMRLFGRQVGARAADAILTAQRASRDNWTMNLSRGMKLPAPMPPAAHAIDAVELRARLQHVQVEAKPPIERETIRASLDASRQAVANASTPAERSTAAAVAAQWLIEDLMYDNAPYLGVDLPSTTSTSNTLPVHVFALGAGLHIVAFPGEPLQGAATKLRDALGDGLVLVGYAHRAASYLPCVDHFAHHGYEVGSTRYRPGTVERLVDAATTMTRDMKDMSS